MCSFFHLISSPVLPTSIPSCCHSSSCPLLLPTIHSHSVTPFLPPPLLPPSSPSFVRSFVSHWHIKSHANISGSHTFQKMGSDASRHQPQNMQKTPPYKALIPSTVFPSEVAGYDPVSFGCRSSVKQRRQSCPRIEARRR